MKSSYKRIGDYIRQVNKRNKDLKVTDLLGINIDKFFMPSVANIVGTDLSVYKLVSRGQFACNRMHVGRDHRIPIALSRNENDFIVSPAYDVFEIIDTNTLLPEYLMMWFSREEFDRNAWFYTDADVRGAISWDAFCNLPIPIPNITEQRAIVDEYHVIQKRIRLNEMMISRLEDTAQALYREWFMDYEFPDDSGKPYKSSGGEMEYSEELGKEVPKGWRMSNLGSIFTPKKGKNITREEVIEGTIPVIAGGIEPSCYHNQSNTKFPVITISASGANAGFVKMYYTKVWSSDSSFIDDTITKNLYFYYVFLKTNQSLIFSMQMGTGQPHIYPEHINSLKIIFSGEGIIEIYNYIISPLFMKISFCEKENENLGKMKDLILAKMASLG